MLERRQRKILPVHHSWELRRIQPFILMPAQLGVTKQDLVGSASKEIHQAFETVPNLGGLQYFLKVAREELKVHKVWPVCFMLRGFANTHCQENCYFHCSSIQEHVRVEGEGLFSKGKLRYPDLARGFVTV